ncbi:MAG: nucleotide sugar dehydrogenase [Methanomassiliicoccales archaeon]|nr:nucleotide sugar dehydrogenase [Methanomassiliicoccales archaeon]
MAKKSVAVVGLGYVGLPLACVFADNGFVTVGVEADKKKTKMISKGVCPIPGKEPGLSELLMKVTKEGRLHVSTDPAECRKADAIFICVDTPINKNKEPMLGCLMDAVSDVGKHLKRGTIVSVESTVPPGTMEEKVIPILEKESGMRAGKDFSVVHCPERVMPGFLLRNLRGYERVIGGLDEESLRKGIAFYSTIVKSKLHPTDLLTAEITKTVENTYRDVQIAFANEVALACEELGADAFEIRRLVNTCPYRDMHSPGAGVGGHCLPKDPWLFASSVSESLTSMIETARAINDSMPEHLAELIVDALDEAGRRPAGSRLTVLGLAFLKDSGDVRNSPAMTVIDAFAGESDVVVHDPFVVKGYKVPITGDIEKALQGSDCVALVTEHTIYKSLDLRRMAELMRTRVIVDGRNVFDASECRKHGFVYRGIGKGK